MVRMGDRSKLLRRATQHLEDCGVDGYSAAEAAGARARE